MLPNPLEEIARKLDEYNKRLSHLERLEQGGAWTLIETVELSAPAASIDFQNIPATFRHLKILASFRSAVVAADDWINVRLNNDAGNNYDRLQVDIHHVSTLTTFESLAATSMLALGGIPAANAPASHFGTHEIFLVDYADTAKHKSAYVLAAFKSANTTGNLRFQNAIGWWRDVSAINRITIIGGSGNLVANSLASLYGING